MWTASEHITSVDRTEVADWLTASVRKLMSLKIWRADWRSTHVVHACLPVLALHPPTHTYTTLSHTQLRRGHGGQARRLGGHRQGALCGRGESP